MLCATLRTWSSILVFDKLRQLKENTIVVLLALSALISVITTAATVVFLTKETWTFLQHVPIWEFLFGTNWSPLLEPKEFGVLPLVCGTLVVTLGAGLLAIPFGLITAIYLSEYAATTTRNFLKPALEILAGIPTVVYGYFGITFVTPLLQKLLPQTEVFNAASGAIVVGLMIIPIITSLADDALQVVPNSLREGAYALGATKLEVSWRIVLHSAWSRILAAFVLALSRAIGETMAVTLAALYSPCWGNP